MADVQDVAAYILDKHGQMSTWKLQKLAYYCQAWHLVWDDVPLFDARIEAWPNGPVVVDLYRNHRGRFSVDAWPDGDPSRLSKSERATIDIVIEDYGALTGRQLSHLTHAEDPWREARGGLPATAYSNNEITPSALQSYYSALDEAEDATAVDELDWTDWEETELG